MPQLIVTPHKSFQFACYLGKFVIHVAFQNVFIYYTTGEQLMDLTLGKNIIAYLKAEGFLD
jgi:hypothetical protein